MFRGALRNAIAPSLQLVAATMFGTRTVQHCMPGGGDVSSSSSSSSSRTSLLVPPPLQPPPPPLPPLPVVPPLCQALPVGSDTGSAPLAVSAIFSGPGYDSDDGEPQSFMLQHASQQQSGGFNWNELAELTVNIMTAGLSGSDGSGDSGSGGGGGSAASSSSSSSSSSGSGSSSSSSSSSGGGSSSATKVPKKAALNQARKASRAASAGAEPDGFPPMRPIQDLRDQMSGTGCAASQLLGLEIGSTAVSLRAVQLRVDELCEAKQPNAYSFVHPCA